MTKAQDRRKARYLKQLRKCGFRSWKRANARRFELIDKKVNETISDTETSELRSLQLLSGLYVDWKTNDSTGRSIRRLDALLSKLKP